MRKPLLLCPLGFSDFPHFPFSPKNSHAICKAWCGWWGGDGPRRIWEPHPECYWLPHWKVIERRNQTYCVTPHPTSAIGVHSNHRPPPTIHQYSLLQVGPD